MVRLPFETGSDKAVRKRAGRQCSCREKQFGATSSVWARSTLPWCGHVQENEHSGSTSGQMVVWFRPAGGFPSAQRCSFTDRFSLMGVWLSAYVQSCFIVGSWSCLIFHFSNRKKICWIFAFQKVMNFGLWCLVEHCNYEKSDCGTGSCDRLP